MMKAFETWNPRIRRLIYDSLRQDLGCQDLDGNNVFGSLAFERICTFNHDPTNPTFNQSERISYARGPLNTGDILTNVSGSNWAYRLETDDEITTRVIFLTADYITKVYGYWISYPVESGIYNVELGIGPDPDHRDTWVEGFSSATPITELRFNASKEQVGNNVVIRADFALTAGSSGLFTFVIERPKKPWVTAWAAWWATAGVRVGKYSSITLPADGLGGASALFPALPTPQRKVTLGFTPDDLLGLAIQKDAETIQIKWFKDADGNYGNQSFTGVSPVLFGNALVYHPEDLGENDLVLYYLHPAIPLSIFARFQRENFLVEHIIHENLTTALVSLIGSKEDRGRQLLYARDALGRDVTLTSPLYSPYLTKDRDLLTLGFVAGNYANSAKPASISAHPAQLSIAIESGAYSDVIVKPTTDLSGDKGTITLAIESGMYA